MLDSDFKGAVFDLDGTLIDSMGVWADIDERFLKGRGITPPPGYTKALKTMGFNQAALYTIKEFGLSDSPEQLSALWYDMAIDAYSHTIPLKPFVKEYLLLLKKRGAGIALATASSRELYEPVLKNNGIYGFFDAFASPGDTVRGKEHPDIYILAAQKLSLDPCRCMAYEDVLGAVISAKRSGMRVTGVYDRYSAEDQPQICRAADLYIKSFGELIL